MGIWYCTREDVKSALDFKETARNNVQVDESIEAASRSVEGYLHRKFYPLAATRYFDWPDSQYRSAYRVWLDQHEIVSVTTLSSGGTTISSSDYFLRPDDGPPFTYVEIDLASNASFGGGSTHQRDITVTGVFGYSADSVVAGATAEALDDSETGVDVTNSALIGVGDIIKVDSERMLVTEKSMITTTQTIQASLTASAAATTVAVTTGSSYFVGEIILLDAERMLIVDISGNNLTVKRAWDGSVLATHSGSTVYAPRTLTVERGALGTTAAAHLTAAAITKHQVPGLVKQLTKAEALESLLQQQGGYASTQGSGSAANASIGAGLDGLRKRTYAAYGRKARMRSV